MASCPARHGASKGRQQQYGPSRASRGISAQPGGVVGHQGPTMSESPPTYAMFLVEQDGAVLVLRRRDLPILGDQWLLPGDAPRPGETPEAACTRFARDELGIDLVGIEPIEDVTL